MPLGPRLRRLALIALPVAALVAAGWWYARPAPIMVRLTTVASGPVEATVANTRAGTIKACHRSRLSLQAGGRVAELRVQEGDRVRAGELLLRLESQDRQALLNQARAQREAARQRNQLSCRSADFDRRDLARANALAEQRLIAQQALDAARTKAATSADACQAGRAELKVAEAAVRLAATQLAQTELRAPFAGIVAEVNGEVGEFATPSPPGVATPPAVDLIDDSCLYVTAPIDEIDAAKLRVGLPARITLDAWRGRAFTGHITRIAPYVLEVEKQARTVAVDVRFDQLPPDVHLLAGHSADIELILAGATLLRVPTEAVQEGPRVLVYDAQQKTIHARRFRKGLSNWTWTGVADGLRAGERIVLSLDRKGVIDGARVEPEIAPP